ncbi:MAG: hypothetical protein ACODAE_06895 [Gemmatimonadota bacterium]
MSELTRSGESSGRAGIGRDELRAIIRHAAELYAAEADAADDRWTEDEVLRIAEELGLPAHHVRRAMYELPLHTRQPSLTDRLCGSGIMTAVRVVADRPDPTLRRLEEYLTTREYHQIRRRRGGRLALEPADDVISRLARRFRRPEGRFHLAHAHRIRVDARPVNDVRTHVRIDLDHSRRRRRLLATGAGAGAVGGGGLGLAAAILTEGALPGLAGTALAAASCAAGVSAGMAAGIGIAVRRYRRWVRAARLEVEGLLDRLEHDDALEPPAAPWVRGIRHRIGIGSRQR